MSLGKWDNRLPGAVRNDIGAVKLEKGTWNCSSDTEKSFYLIAWDFAFKCRYEDCGLFERCTYVKHWTMRREDLGKQGRTDKCRMQQRYMKSIIYAFVEKMRSAKKSEQESVIKLGFHLLPLYAQLFKFKLLEIDNDELLMRTARGDSKINPIYKEIREIIKTITTVWKDIGSSTRMKMNIRDVGDSAFIDAMYSAVEGDDEDEDADKSVSEKGTSWDFDEEDSPDADEEGEGLDLDKYNTVETGKKVSDKQISYIEKSSTKTKNKKRKIKRKRGRPKKKPEKEVPSYCRKNRKTEKET